MCFIAVIFIFCFCFAQAKNLLALSHMSGDRKKEMCDKFANMERQMGLGGVMQLMECGGDFPAAFEQAKVLCGAGGPRPGSCDATNQPGDNGRRSLQGLTEGPGSAMCNTVCTKAKAQVHLFVCACLYV